MSNILDHTIEVKVRVYSYIDLPLVSITIIKTDSLGNSVEYKPVYITDTNIAEAIPVYVKEILEKWVYKVQE